MSQSSPPTLADNSWICVYPNYLDANKTVAEGRRISKSIAVPSPNVRELGEVCSALGLKYAIEDKAYPRDWLVPGRVRIERKESTTKDSILKQLAVAIAGLKHRLVKPAPPAQTKKGKK